MNEPRAPDATGPTRRDWLLVAALVATIVVEAIVRPEIVWKPFAAAVAIALAFVLPWRRTHPLFAVVLAFGTASAIDIAIIATGASATAEGSTGMYAQVYFLLLPYALFRWASGRDITIGSGVLAAAVVFGVSSNWTGVGDAIGAFAIVLASVAVGAAVRNRVTGRTREVAQIKLLERERLARELHDTVAHHVSAIIIQAQAGRALAPTDPDAAVEALEVIETAAAETLAEMRAMVRILRDAEAADLAPQGGVADIVRLAQRAGTDGPRIDVELSEGLDDLTPAVDAAVYRLVQESITNASRHARDATRVQVHVASQGDGVLRLRVHDDGDTSHVGSSWLTGFGLVGMAERARLLGGTCEAGPDPAGGWTVTAVLPRNGNA